MKFWEEVQERERENDLSARWQPSGGRKNKLCFLTEVVPLSLEKGSARALKKVVPVFDLYPKGRASI